MAINSITAVTDGGGGTSTSTVTVTNPEVVTSDSTLSAEALSNVDITGYVTPIKSSIEEFKAASVLITDYRNNIKTEMDELALNVYSSINQMNFSVKMITDVNNFLSKYINTATSIKDNLTLVLTGAIDFVPSFSLYDNVTFNNSFVSSIVFFENFSRILIEAVSYYLTYDGVSNITVQTMYANYCTAMFIQNDWVAFKNQFDNVYQTYNDMFSITVWATLDGSVDEDDPILVAQQRIADEYANYRSIFNNINLIFNTIGVEYTPSQIQDLVVPVIRGIVTFKSGSVLYDKHLDSLDTTIEETNNILKRILTYTTTLINRNVEYQSGFKEDNTYLTTIVDVCTLSTELLAQLTFTYPNRDARQGLITDSNFTSVLTTLNNLFRREIETSVTLLDNLNKDYKLIRSLQTFIAEDDSIDNSILFSIMNSFDGQLLDITINDTDTLSSLLRLYFEDTSNSVNVFGTNSFNKILADAGLLTDPMYDILNYYRLFLYPFLNDSTSGASLIFDMLETFYIYNKSITNSDFNTAMDDLFDLKINNLDYEHVNESKINESLTARYEGLNYLNYYNIQPYVDIIKTADLDTISTIADITSLLNNITGYDLMLFTITENILYNNIDLNKIMTVLSIKTNIRTILTKLMFHIAISNLIDSINTFYSNNPPSNLQLFTDLSNITTDFIDDLTYLQLLINAKDYYNGNSNIFNNALIINTTDNNIWDTTKLPTVIKLFSIYKEV